MSLPRDAVTVRPALLDDRAAAAALVGAATAGSPYAELPAYFLHRAFDTAGSECRVVLAESTGAVIGCALYGDVAGTVGTGRVQFVAVAPEQRRAGVGRALCEAAIADLAAHGMRTVVVEMPDDPLHASGRAWLDACGFAVVARVADYYRDAVDLIVLERRTA